MNTTPNRILSRTKLFLCISGALAVAAISTHAANLTWGGGALGAGNDNFNVAQRWTGNVIPGSADNAIVNNGNIITITDTRTVVDILPANAASGTGTFIQNAGTVTVNGWFRMGNANLANGTYTLNGGVLNVNPANSQMNIGEAAGSTGTLNITGGTLNKGGSGGNLWAGKSGTGIINISGTGFLNSANGLKLGDRSQGAGSTGTANQSGGTNTLGGELWVGNNSGGVGIAGTYNLSGGILNVNNWLAIGRSSANGVFNMTGGVLNKNAGGNFTIAGIGTTQTGTFTQSGGAFTNTATETWVGENAIGNFTITNTAVARLGLLRLGLVTPANGTVNLDGGTLTVNSMNKGTGTGTFNFNGGTLKAGGNSAIFMTGLTTANVKAGGAIIDDGGFAITIGQALVNNGGGGLTKNGTGSVTLTGANTYTGAAAVNAGTLALNTASTGAGSYAVADTSKLSVTAHVLNGQMNMSTLTLATSTSATLDVDLAAFGTPTQAPVNVVGALTLNGAITLNVPNGLVAVGEIPLVKYGSLAGAGSVTLGTVPLGVQGYLTNNTGANPNTYSLVATSVGLPRWEGATNGVPVADWDINTTSNWIERTTGNPTVYAEANPVLFSDQATGTNVVTLTTTMNPSTVLVNNTNKDYTINGAGKISGTTGLTKQGTGALTINSSANDFTGPMLVSRGTVTVNSIGNGGVASSIGASSANAANLVIESATLVFDGPEAVTDRSFTAASTNSTLTTVSNLTVSSQTTAANSALIKRGAGQLTYVGSGMIQVGNGSFPAYQVAAGTVMFDGSAGGQVITNNGEMWVGGTTTSGASLIVSNSSLSMNNWFAVGRGNGSIGNQTTVDLHNSTFAAGNMSLGYDGGLGGNLNSQTMTLNNSTVRNTGNFFIGESVGALSIVNMNGNSTNLMVNLNVGMTAGSTGIVNQAGGFLGRLSGGTDWIIGGIGSAANASAIGIYNLSGGVMESGGNFQVGAYGRGTWNQSGGVANLQNFPVLGRYVGGIGTMTVSGGTFNQTGAGQFLILGESGTGTLTLSSAGFVNAVGGVSIAHTTTGNGTLNLEGGTLTTRIIQSPGTGTGGVSTLNLNGGTLVADPAASLNFISNLTSANVLAGGVTIDSGSATIGIVQALLNGGGGGLTKIGAGTLYLNGVNTYAGTTTVSNGTLGGNGTIAGPVVVVSGATLAAGTSIGTFTVGGAATVDGTIAAEIASGPSADLINFVGGATLSGPLTVTASGSLTPGQTFNLFDGALSGTFSTVTVPGGLTHWNTSALYTSGELTFINNAPTAANFGTGVGVGGSTTSSVIGKFAPALDADNEAVTIVSVSTPSSGTAIIVGGTNIAYTSTGGPGSDSFTYTVSDGLSTATATVTVTVSSPEGFNKLSGPTGSGPYAFSYLGIPGEDYALEESPNLVAPYTWFPVTTNTAAGNGALDYLGVTLSYPSGSFRTRHIP